MKSFAVAIPLLREQQATLKGRERVLACQPRRGRRLSAPACKGLPDLRELHLGMPTAWGTVAATSKQSSSFKPASAVEAQQRATARVAENPALHFFPTGDLARYKRAQLSKHTSPHQLLKALKFTHSCAITHKVMRTTRIARIHGTTS